MKKAMKSCSMKKAMKSCSSFDFGSFIVLAAGDYSSKTFKRKLSVVMVSPSSDEEDDLVKLKTLVVPPPKYKFEVMVGSCNGLVCLSDEDLNEFIIWNPTTGEHRMLPKPESSDEGWNNRLAAFGFDLETKDYKVVLITGPTPSSYRPVAPIKCLCQVQVYRLSTHSWRLLEEGIISLPGCVFSCLDDVLYLDGSCFFMALFFHTRQQPCFPESDRFIISFDFIKEIFNPIQLPDHHRDQELYLRSLGDKIALFTKSYRKAGTCEEFNIWLLNEERSSSNHTSMVNNKESWTKLHFFQIKHERSEESKPIGLSNDGQFALLETSGSKKVKLYDLISKEVKQSLLSCCFLLSKAHPYKPSLVSIIGGNGNGAGNGNGGGGIE